MEPDAIPVEIHHYPSCLHLDIGSFPVQNFESLTVSIPHFPPMAPAEGWWFPRGIFGSRCDDMTGSTRLYGVVLAICLALPSLALGQAISFSPPSVDFGNQQVGITSPTQTITVTNTGSATLTISKIFLTGGNHSDFFQTNHCKNSWAPGASCTITVSFTPSATGARSTSVSVTDNAPGSPQLVSLSGTGIAPSASLSTSSLFFGGQLVGSTSAPQSVTLSNIGAAPMNITSIAANNDFSQTNNCGVSLAAGESCAINVSFTPTSAWSRGGSILITDNSYGSSTQVLLLTGMGDSGAVGTLSAASLDFGKVNIGATSVTKSFTLTNRGTAVLSINNIAATGDYAQSNNCPSSLNINSSCTVNVTFTPTAANLRNGWVTIFDTDASLLETVTLSGAGVAPTTTVAVSPQAAAVTITQTQQFTATIRGIPSTNVTWAVDGVVGGNSGIGTISTAGLYTPPHATGAHRVTATSIAEPGQSATSPMFVTGYAGTYTYKNDNYRSGLNSQETVLTTGTVNKNQFGKLFSYTVDGYVYAQPLYVANLNIPNQGYHNVLYIATEHDSVYAFDADNRTPNILWQVSFINPTAGVTTVPSGDVETGNDLIPEIGITGTPVIDPAVNTLFVVVRTKEVSGSVTSYMQRLHALDLATGAEKSGSPVVIQATVSGTGTGSVGGQVSFDSQYDNSRPALLLLNGTVYVTWGSLEDLGNFHGWVLGYNETTLLQTGVWNSTPNGADGGVWQGGGGLAADSSGNIYFATGNGTLDANTGGVDYGDSVVKLSTANGILTATDYFSPYNQASLSTLNWDLGAGGTMLLPDQPGSTPHLALAGGKGGTIYLVNRDNLGQYNATSNQNLFTYPALVGSVVENGGNRGGPAYWQGQVYYAGALDYVRQFGMYNGLMSAVSMASSASGSLYFGYPGGGTAVSANGNLNGILWVLKTGNYWDGGPAVLRAFDAANVSREAYDTIQNKARDQVGPAVKFAVPTVANGKVYVGTQTEIDVYGLLP
jgi:hypothetical protein